jgi:hypoxanthine phosphoribosyltransferase
MSPAPPPELCFISHETFLEGVEALALELEADSWRPTFLVGVGRGGLVPAAYLSHRMDIPMLSVDYSSGEPEFAGELLGKLALKTTQGSRILVIDDINDSGSTILQLRNGITKRGGPEEQVRVAVMINNIRSQATVDYSATKIDRRADKRWFVFPWEAVANPAALIDEALSVPERLA